MADFVQTMKDWRRMCQHMDKVGVDRSCDICPLGGCNAIYEEDGSTDYANVEEKVAAWAAEHPIVYPTWEEWLVDNGVFTSEDVRSHGDYRFYMNGRPMCNIPTEKIYSQIPADIAQKLGIEPKEG